MKKILLLALAFCFTLAFSGAAMAITWIESGDAGQLPGTAQVIGVANPLTQIVGNLGSINDPNSLFDVDMFQINIFDPLNFSATTLEGADLVSDPQMFLFDSNGRGIYMNDDGTGLGSQSQLPAGDPLRPVSPGLYYLAIGWFDNEPFSESNGRIFIDTSLDTTVVAGPDLTGGAYPIFSWNNDVSGRDDSITPYQIDLTGAAGVPVPEPGTLILLGSGLCGMFGYKLRCRRNSRTERT